MHARATVNPSEAFGTPRNRRGRHRQPDRSYPTAKTCFATNDLQDFLRPLLRNWCRSLPMPSPRFEAGPKQSGTSARSSGDVLRRDQAGFPGRSVTSATRSSGTRALGVTECADRARNAASAHQGLRGSAARSAQRSKQQSTPTHPVLSSRAGVSPSAVDVAMPGGSNR